MKERKNARRFVMKIQEEKVKLKQEVLKKIRKEDSMSATIQKLFDDFDVRLLGVDSDRVMAFDPLTATPRRTFCVDDTILYDDKVAVTTFSDTVIHMIDVIVQFQVVQQIKTARRYEGVGCGGKDGTLVSVSS
nr:hypothetical protein BaRGS_031492 [Batillaria attramentaria]